MSFFAYRLLSVHRRLDEEIRRHQRQRWPDLTRIQRLKKLKLAIKDRLHRIASGGTPIRPV